MRILNENEILVAYIPITNRALVFRVKSLQNKDATRIDYGPLPLNEGDSLPTYTGGTATVPEDGVFPANAYTPMDGALTFPLEGAFDKNDMWYLPKDYNDRIFHVIGYYTPSWLRARVEIPIRTIQGRFQKDKVMTGVQYDFGFARGFTETIHLPNIRYGYLFGNDTNMTVYTRVTFEYGEYLIEIPRDAEFIFNVLQGKVKAYWVTLPIVGSYDESVKKALNDVYGFEGFKLYGIYDKEKAVKEYSEHLRVVKV